MNCGVCGAYNGDIVSSLYARARAVSAARDDF